MGSAIDMSLADWRRQMAVNVDGVFLTAKYGVPLMRRSGGGSVVMMSSVAGIRGSANLACYSATKGAVRLFAKSLALECATARDNIRVNSVHPGIIDTPIWTKLPPGANAPLDPHKVAEMSVPLGVAGQAEDIANGVLFLCSDASRHMTGSELVIDGGDDGWSGWTIGWLRPGCRRHGTESEAAMKITKLTTFMVPPRWLFLKIETDEGITGWGEPVVEGRAATVAAGVAELADYLIGKDPRRSKITGRCCIAAASIAAARSI